MKKILIYFCIITSMVHNTTNSMTTADTALTENDLWGQNDIATYASIIFNPVWNGQPNPYPTDSSNSAAVDSFYGSLGIDSTIVRYIKNAYFFFEYCTKLEMGARIAALGHSLNIDVDTLLEESDPWTSLVNEVNKKTGSLSSTIDQAYNTTIVPAYEDIRGTIEATYWSEIPSTSFWKALPVTQEMIQQSELWQNYLQYLIIQTFNQTTNILTQIKQSEEAIFKYIPNIEVAYYQDTFTSLRNSAELLRINLILVDSVRQRAHDACTNWQSLDMAQTYSATTTFTDTPYFKALSFAESQPQQVLLQTATLQSVLTSDDVKTDPLIVEKITGYSMIKIIQTLTNSIYDPGNLAATMEKLSSSSLPQPSLLLFTQQDTALLEDRNTVIDAVQAQSSGTTIAYGNLDFDTLIEIAGWSDFWDDVGDAFIDAGKSFGEGVAGLGAEVGSVILKPIAAGVSLFDPEAGADILSTSTKLADFASQEFLLSASDALNAINDVVDAGDQLVYVGAEALGSLVSFITNDPTIGEDLQMTLSTLGEAAIEIWAAPFEVSVEAGYTIVQLTSDAVNSAASLVADSVIAARTGDSSIFGQDFVGSLKTFAADFASSMLSFFTLVGNFTMDILQDLIMGVGYLTSFIVDVAYKAVEGLAYAGASVIAAFDTDVDPSAVEGQVTTFLEQHRKFSEAVVNTAILVGVSAVTGGAGGAAMMAMNAGMGAFQIIGGEQADEAQMEEAQEQTEFLNSYSIYVENNRVIIQEQMDDWEQEFNEKFKDQISNQERGLGFYQNFMDSYFESIKESMSNSVGAYLAPQLSPQSNGLVYADVGALYGLSTQTYNLNPSQGFPLYNKGRSAFSQEVAVAPALNVSGDTTEQLTTDAASLEKFWFNQKETIPLDQPATEIEIKIQGIYVLNEFYIGLYFGGQNYNIQDIIDTKQAPVDAARTAKMLVYKQTASDSQPTAGLYEHEGFGWISKSLQVPAFAVGTWYHMKMQLNGNYLNVKIWQDGDSEPAGQVFKVTVDSTNPPQTMGIISSGASVEYQIVTPEVTIKDNTAVRTQPSSGFEKTREITARQTMNRLRSPQVGTLNLEPLDMTSLIKGQYIYTTQDTKLKDAQQSSINDYVVLCQLTSGNQAVRTSSIGLSIEQEGATGIVSLITGNYYDINAQKIGFYDDIFNIYKLYHGPLSSDVTEKIEAQRQLYLEQFTAPTTFGSLSLQATSIEDIVSGHYIYTALSPEQELNPTDTTLSDYFLVAQDSKLEKIGVRLTDSSPAIVSLITGYAYNRSSTDPINSRAYDVISLLESYQSQYGTLRQDLLDEITATQSYYASQVQQEDLQDITVTTTPISEPTGSLAGTKIPDTKTDDSGADESLQQNQISASGGFITGGF